MTVFLTNRDGNGKTNEEGHYKLLSSILSGNVQPAVALKVTQSATPALSVSVAPGIYKIDTPDFSYVGWLDAAESVSIATPPATNARITTIVAYVDKNATTSPAPPNNPGITKIVAVDGATSSNPIAPNDAVISSAVKSGNPFLKLANVTVRAGATQITDNDIADLRLPLKLSPTILSADSLNAMVGPLIYPVGSLYMNADDGTNPATLLGFGTWVAHGQGRVPVGVAQGDADFGSISKMGGSKTATLATANIPSHYHIIDPPGVNTNTTGNHTHALYGDPVYTSAGGNSRAYNGGNGQQFRWSAGGVQAAGNHNHWVDIPAFNSSSVGSNQPFSILPPFVTVYMWRRVA